MKLGCCARCGDIERVAQAGFDFIDLDGAELAGLPEADAEAAAARLRSCGLPCLGLHASVPPDVLLAGPGFREERTRRYFRSLAPRAAAVGARFVCVGSPRSRTLPPGYPRGEADAQMLRSLKAACEEMPGQRVLLESLNRGETNYLNTVAEAAALCERAQAEPGLVLDLYHFALCGEELAALAPGTLARVEYLHVADPAGRRYPSEATAPAFLRLVADAARLAPCGHMAIEAESRDRQRDAPAALKLLRELTN